MADLRLIALGALAACSRADAEPPGLAVPKTWVKLPGIAEAVRTAAAGPKIEVVSADAWGERAMGCYAVRFEVRGHNKMSALADQIIAGIAAEKIVVKDIVKPPGAGVLALAFERAPYRGRLRAQLAPDAITAVACFANQREPQACAAACDGVLGGVK